jgi:hypothetical protein
MSSCNKKFHSAKAGIKRHTVYDPDIRATNDKKFWSLLDIILGALLKKLQRFAYISWI